MTLFQNQMNMPRTPTRTNNQQMFPQQQSPFSNNMRHQSPGLPPNSPNQFNQQNFGSPQQFGSPMSHSPSQRGKAPGANKMGMKHEDEVRLLFSIHSFRYFSRNCIFLMIEI